MNLVYLDDGYVDTYTYALPILEEMSIPCAIAVASAQVGGNQRSIPIISWGHLREAAKKHIIACHGMNHVAITPDNFEEEVLDAKAIMESKLGMSVTHFVFPYDKQPEDDSVMMELKRIFHIIRPTRGYNLPVYHLIGVNNPTGFKFFTYVDDFKKEMQHIFGEQGEKK